MKNIVKTILLTFSLGFNALFILVFMLVASSKSSTLSYYRPDKNGMTAAVVVSVPRSRAVVFEPVEITLQKNDQAALQYSVIASGAQANRLITALYDRDLIRVEDTGYGIIITALNEGDTMMQTVTADGIVNIARITIIP